MAKLMSQKRSAPKSDRDAIRQRKSYRKKVLATMLMKGGTEIRNRYTVEKVIHNPSNRNARVNGLTVGDSWELAKARS